jgi:hypothetical protein
MAPMFEHLTLLQKVEVFEHALDNTTGADLAKVLWFKSRNSEMWLYRRTNYTRSLAVMSMVRTHLLRVVDRATTLLIVSVVSLAVADVQVGYVLGLGDRHPSNLVLHRRSGKILHIDFGDCFEVCACVCARVCLCVGVCWCVCVCVVGTVVDGLCRSLTCCGDDAGGHDPREVPRESPVPAHSHAHYRHGGVWHRGQLPIHVQRGDESAAGGTPQPVVSISCLLCDQRCLTLLLMASLCRALAASR